MNKIDNLIKRIHNAKVEYVFLSELEEKGIIQLGRGKIISKDEIRNVPGDFPVYSSSSTGDGEIGRYGKYMFDDERITWSIDGGGKFFYRNNIKYSVTNVGGWLKVLNNSYINTKYLYYFLINAWATKTFNYIKKAHPSVIRDEYCIAVPPLEIQCEIVHVLDHFTLLSAELSAELKAREKQYKEYINILLNEKNMNKYKKIKLKELFDFRNGLSKGKEFFGSGTPFVRYTDVYNKRFLHIEDINEKVNCTDKELETLKVKRGDVFFTRTSEIAEEVGYSSVMLDNIENCVFNGFTIKATPKTELLIPEYCAFCFSTDIFRQYVSTRCAFTTRASLTGKTIGEFELCVPSIQEQEKIVKQLMSLYKLVNDISEGLPAEIEARQKQYEYYRDKLLTFKELVNEG